MKATVKLNDKYSESFAVTRGTRQGSLLSPQLFNIFIDDLLQELQNCSDKVCIGASKVNSFACADDINLLCTTAPGLQRLIDICSAYADKWRFKFGIHKTKCMIVAEGKLASAPTFYLKGEPIAIVPSLEILGVHYDSKNTVHINSRIEKCKQVFYSLKDVGMAYPGCASDVKAYTWNTVCQPVLIYGLDSLSMSQSSLDKLESTQGTLLKQCIGLNKRSKSSNLLQALCVPKVKDRLKQSIASLLKRVFAVDSSVRDINVHFLSLYFSKGELIHGALVERAVSAGLSPTRCAFVKYKKPTFVRECGVTDSLRTLLMHENFIKPYSEEQTLASLLTRAFS